MNNEDLLMKKRKHQKEDQVETEFLEEENGIRQHIQTLSVQDAIPFINLCYSQIALEHQLINNRMTWYVTGQSFLITALSVSMTGHPDIFRKYFDLIVCLIGILTTSITIESVRAARTVIDRWRTTRLDQIKLSSIPLKHYLVFREIPVADKRPKDEFDVRGDRSIVWTPTIFLVGWCILLILSSYVNYTITPARTAAIQPVSRQ